MGNDLFSYIEKLELLAFFSGYPILYALVHLLAGEPGIKFVFAKKLCWLLPIAYAFSGSLFLGLLIRNMHPNDSLQNILSQWPGNVLKIWGISSVLFWIPFFNQKTVFSLIHSLVFFAIFLKDILLSLYSASPEILKNDMRMYFVSIALYTGILSVIALMKVLSAADPDHSSP